MIVNIFNIFLYQPLFNFLIVLYKYVPGSDFGIAIIILTVLIRFLFYPLTVKSIRSQKAISEIQPKIKEVQEKHKNDKEKQVKEIMELYKKEKINPFSGFLPILIQLPVLIALYRVFWQGLNPEEMSLLYSFIASPGEINHFFLGIVNLAQPNIILALLVGLSQFIQTKMTFSKNKNKAQKGDKSDFSRIMQSQMQYFFPVFIVLILLKLPAALGLYIFTSNIFTIIQQYFVLRSSLNHFS